MSAPWIASLQEFATQAALLPPKPAPRCVLFTASRDAATGQPWCPDCVRALPVVREEVGRSGGTLLEVEVGRMLKKITPKSDRE